MSCASFILDFYKFFMRSWLLIYHLKSLSKTTSEDHRNFNFNCMIWFVVVLSFIEIHEVYSRLNSTSASKLCSIGEGLHAWLLQTQCVVSWKLGFCKQELALWYGCLGGSVLPEPPTLPSLPPGCQRWGNGWVPPFSMTFRARASYHTYHSSAAPWERGEMVCGCNELSFQALWREVEGTTEAKILPL